jgi:exosortase
MDSAISSNEQKKTMNRANPLAFGSMIALSPLLLLEGFRLWAEPHFQFFPISIGFALWLLLREKKKPCGSRLVLPVIVIGLLIGIVAQILFSPLAAHCGAWVIACGWFLRSCPTTPWTRILGIWGTTLLCIPPPGNLDKKLISTLQIASSAVCESVLDVLQIPVLREGNVIELMEKRLFVEEACSGVDSLYALAAVAAGMLVLTRTPFIPSVLTLTTVPLWAILGNFVRLIAIVLAWHFFQFDLSAGWNHQILGFVIFIGVSCCHLATAHLFREITKQIPIASNQENKAVLLVNRILNWPRSESRGSRSEPRRYENTFFLSLGGIFVMTSLFLGSLTLMVIQKESIIQAANPKDPGADVYGMLPDDKYSRELLGDKVESTFQKVTRERNSIWGTHSHVWTFPYQSHRCALSLDFPFYGWHELMECYVNTGWKIEESLFAHPAVSDAGTKRFKMRNSTGRYGIVWYGNFDANCQRAQPPSLSDQKIKPHLFSRAFRQDVDGPLKQSQLLFQFQLLVESDEPITPGSESELHVLFEQAFERARVGSQPALQTMR